ncbi:helix-turn-helix domain-containing protein [Streptomyces sp. NPDC058000]|uniref:helix-turn-helix domain-containing protein n=1 Tax=Streptomyces sp. NPDC058000 TaxID=3346299 RepID=UPI0036EEA2A9
MRELIVRGTNEGLDAARARGARDLLTWPENTVTSIAKLLGVSRNTIYKYVPELKGGRIALANATGTPGLPGPAQPAE